MLSRRLSQVLTLIALGRSNKEIATELGISYGTAKEYTSRLFRKINVRTRYEAMMWYKRNGSGQLPKISDSSKCKLDTVLL